MGDDRPEENVQETESRLVKPIFGQKEDGQEVNAPDEKENIADLGGAALFAGGNGWNQAAGDAQIIGGRFFVGRVIIDDRRFTVFAGIAMDGAVAPIDDDFFAFVEELG